MTSIIKKLLYIIIFAVIYFVLERFMRITTALEYIHFSYSHPLLNAVSIIIGPFVGSFASGLGEFLVYWSQNLPTDWGSVLCSFLNCGTVGFLMKNVDIKSGFFMRTDIKRYNISQFTSTFVCWSIIYPIFNVLMKVKDFQSSFNYGFGHFVGIGLTNFVAGTLMLTLYAKNRISAANFYRS